MVILHDTTPSPPPSPLFPPLLHDLILHIFPHLTFWVFSGTCSVTVVSSLHHANHILMTRSWRHLLIARLVRDRHAVRDLWSKIRSWLQLCRLMVWYVSRASRTSHKWHASRSEMKVKYSPHYIRICTYIYIHTYFISGFSYTQTISALFITI